MKVTHTYNYLVYIYMCGKIMLNNAEQVRLCFVIINGSRFDFTNLIVFMLSNGEYVTYYVIYKILNDVARYIFTVRYNKTKFEQ